MTLAQSAKIYTLAVHRRRSGLPNPLADDRHHSRYRHDARLIGAQRRPPGPRNLRADPAAAKSPHDRRRRSASAWPVVPGFPAIPFLILSRRASASSATSSGPTRAASPPKRPPASAPWKPRSKAMQWCAAAPKTML